MKTNLIPSTTAKLHREKMWELYSRYYNADKKAFFHRFQSNDYYAFYTDRNELIGFTGFRTKLVKTPQGTVQTLYIGQTVIDQLYRGNSLIPRTCCRIFAQLFLRRPFCPIYVWCDALTYKPYLLFANALSDYYPHRNKVKSPKIKSLIDQLGQHYYGANYCTEHGTVRKAVNVIDDPTALIHPELRQHPDIDFYATTNPRYAEGHGLITLAPITLRNFYCLLKKCLKKRLTKK